MRRRGAAGKPTTVRPGGEHEPRRLRNRCRLRQTREAGLYDRHAPTIGPGDPDSGSGADVGARRPRSPTSEGGTETRDTPGGAPDTSAAKTSLTASAGSPRTGQTSIEASSDRYRADLPTRRWIRRPSADFDGPGLPRVPSAHSNHPTRAGRADGPAGRPLMRNGTYAFRSGNAHRRAANIAKRDCLITSKGEPFIGTGNSPLGNLD